MLTEKTPQEFTFTSPPGGKFRLCLSGIGSILFSVLCFQLFLAPRVLKGQYLLSAVLSVLFFWTLGCLILLASCDVRVLAGQFSFRRVLSWRSVPLGSIARVAVPWPPAVYVMIDHNGIRNRVVFYAGRNEGPHGCAVVEFLREVCAKNAESSHYHP